MTKPWLKKMWWVPIAFMVGALLVANVGGLLLTVTDRQVVQAVERKAAIEADWKRNSDQAAADCTIENGCVGHGGPEKYVGQEPFVLASFNLPSGPVLDQKGRVNKDYVPVLVLFVGAVLCGMFLAVARRPRS